MAEESAPSAVADSDHVASGSSSRGTDREHLQLEELARLCPVFRRDPPVFLAPQVHRALDDRLGQRYTARSIARALREYKSTAEYRAVALEGAPMYDLDGNVVGAASAEQASTAANPTPKKERPKKEMPPPPLLLMLSQRFPELFDLQQPRPLPRGTYNELLTRLGKKYPPAAIAEALHHFCSMEQYRKAVKEASLAKPQQVANSAADTTSVDVDALQKQELTAQELTRRYPAVFGAIGARPLAASVRVDVHAQLEAEFSKTSIKAAIRSHRLQEHYLRVLVAGAPRVNLRGEIEGSVSEDEARLALELLADPVRRSKWLRRLQDGKSLNLWHRQELLEHLEGSSVSPEEFAERHGVPALAVVVQYKLAGRERALRLAAQRNIVAAYRASGLSKKEFAEKKWIKVSALARAISAVEAEDIATALAATIAAQEHAPLDLHSHRGDEPAPQHAAQACKPAVSVRKKRRIEIAGAADPLQHAGAVPSDRR